MSEMLDSVVTVILGALWQLYFLTAVCFIGAVVLRGKGALAKVFASVSLALSFVHVGVCLHVINGVQTYTHFQVLSLPAGGLAILWLFVIWRSWRMLKQN